MSRKSLLKRAPRRIQVNGDEVIVRSLTLREAFRFDEMTKEDPSKALKYLTCHAVIDDAGQPVFTDEADPELDDIPTDTLRVIGEEVTRLSASGKAASAEKN